MARNIDKRKWETNYIISPWKISLFGGRCNSTWRWRHMNDFYLIDNFKCSIYRLSRQKPSPCRDSWIPRNPNPYMPVHLFFRSLHLFYWSIADLSWDRAGTIRKQQGEDRRRQCEGCTWAFFFVLRILFINLFKVLYHFVQLVRVVTRDQLDKISDVILVL